MRVPYRFAICNEVFGKLPFDKTCKQVRELGYKGLEIAPYTLADDPLTISPDERAELCRAMDSEGLTFVGLHWLLVSPVGLHVSTRDEGIRKRTWEHVHHLIDLCADLSGCRSEHNGVLVFGSPKQRSAVDGMTPKEATDVFTHELAHAAPHAESRGVKILVEALPANQSNIVNCLADAVTIVKQIGSPAIQTMFDTHNAIDERDSHPSLVRRYFQYIRHVHVNETDGREPGTGDYDFASLLSALAELNYSGWVSIEAFDFSRDAREIAQSAITHLQNAAQQSAAQQSAFSQTA
jgi:D-psicose/D-tagatose/L-ribulose 3-epimerase